MTIEFNRLPDFVRDLESIVLLIPNLFLGPFDECSWLGNAPSSQKQNLESPIGRGSSIVILKARFFGYFEQ
jgi:hypothetical protein